MRDEPSSSPAATSSSGTHVDDHCSPTSTVKVTTTVAPNRAQCCAMRPILRRRNHGRATSHAARSTSNATTLRDSLLNSTATKWIGCPRCRYLSA